MISFALLYLAAFDLIWVNTEPEMVMAKIGVYGVASDAVLLALFVAGLAIYETGLRRGRFYKRGRRAHWR